MLANINPQMVLEVKSKYDAEFRRFGLHRQSLVKFEEFYHLIESLHGLNGIQFNICYTDRDGDLLPINNDNNLGRVLNVTTGVLRLIIQRKGECYNNGSQIYSNSYVSQNTSNSHVNHNTNGNNYSNSSYRANNLITQIKSLKDLSTTFSYSQNSQKPFISLPEDFRPVSAIIDVDILPDKYRRIRLNKHKCSKPLGFYIKDGRSLRVTPQGVEQVPGVFISRLMPGGLAESTGLLSVSDEVIEVNGIEVAGKTLDQVTDMMVANSSNLIITVKPSNQRYNLNRSTNVSGSNQQPQIQMPNMKKIQHPQLNNNFGNKQNQSLNNNSKTLSSNASTKNYDNSGGLKNGTSQAQSVSSNKRPQTDTPSLSSVNSSFSSNRASHQASIPTENGQINLEFNSSSNSGQKSAKDLDHDHDHHNDIDEDDDEEIITGHAHVNAGVNSNQASTTTSESNSPHRATTNMNHTDLNSSGDENDNDNSDDKILTL